jgi:hypothetical protein
VGRDDAAAAREQRWFQVAPEPTPGACQPPTMPTRRPGAGDVHGTTEPDGLRVALALVVLPDAGMVRRNDQASTAEGPADDLAGGPDVGRGTVHATMSPARAVVLDRIPDVLLRGVGMGYGIRCIVDTTARCAAPRDGQGVVRAGNACVQDGVPFAPGTIASGVTARSRVPSPRACPCRAATTVGDGAVSGWEVTGCSSRCYWSEEPPAWTTACGGVGGAADARVGPLLHLLSDGDVALTRRVCLRAGTVSAVAVTTVPHVRTVMAVGGGAQRHARRGPTRAAGRSGTVHHQCVPIVLHQQRWREVKHSLHLIPQIIMI